jgi:hypothetical protein
MKIATSHFFPFFEKMLASPKFRPGHEEISFFVSNQVFLGNQCVSA